MADGTGNEVLVVCTVVVAGAAVIAAVANVLLARRTSHMASATRTLADKTTEYAEATRDILATNRDLVEIGRRTEALAVRPKVAAVPQPEPQGGKDVLRFRLRNLSENEALKLKIDARPAGASARWGCPGAPYEALEAAPMTEGPVTAQWEFQRPPEEQVPEAAEYFEVTLYYEDVLGHQHTRVYYLWGDPGPVADWPRDMANLRPVLQSHPVPPSALEGARS